jgi:hypothetical protein
MLAGGYGQKDGSKGAGQGNDHPTKKGYFLTGVSTDAPLPVKGIISEPTFQPADVEMDAFGGITIGAYIYGNLSPGQQESGKSMSKLMEQDGEYPYDNSKDQEGDQGAQYNKRDHEWYSSFWKF